jgi:WD40 repeat protein
MTTSAQDKPASQRSDVFISYSRKDREFVKRLEEELERRGREAWVDWEGIRPAEEFMQAIFPAIEGTDTFIFVLSPDSVTSEICGKELAHAVSHNKRMIPIMARETEATAVPEPLSKLNWVFARDADSFEAATDFLISALDTDLGWVRAHTRLLTRAIEWEAKARSNSFVLRGEDLRAAEQWLAQAGTEKERQPTALQTEYIIASRKAASRRQRIILGAVSLGLVVAIGLAIVSLFLRSRAIAGETKAISEEARAKREASHSEFLRGSTSLDADDGGEALLSFYKAVELNPSNAEAATALVNLLGQRQWPHQVASQSHSFSVQALQRSADGRRIVATGSAPAFESALAQISVLDAKTLRAGEPIQVAGAEDFAQLAVSATGDRILAVGQEHKSAESPQTVLLNAETGKPVKKWTHGPLADYVGWFSQDGKWALVYQEIGANADAEARNAPKPERWLEIVSAADGSPHPALAKIPLLGKPVAAMVLQTELRLVHSDGRVTTQPLAKSKRDAAQTLLTIEKIGEIKAIQFSPDGRQLSGAAASNLVIWDIPEPGSQQSSLEEWKLANFVSTQALARDFSSYSIQAFFDGPEQATFQASGGGSVHSPPSMALRVRGDQIGDGRAKVELAAEWSGDVSAICVLPSGVAGARGTIAFVQPFDGGAFSGALRHSGAITAICAAGKDALVTGSQDGDVKLWHLSTPAFASAPRERPAPDRPATERRARTPDGAANPVELWSELFQPPPLSEDETNPPPPDAPMDNSPKEDRLILVRAGVRQAVELGDAESSAKRIDRAELTADGTRAIFNGPKQQEFDYDSSGAWVFRTDHPEHLFALPTHCSWAGFSPDRQVLTIFNGRLVFWEETPATDGRLAFKPSGRVLAQAGMEAAVFAAGGTRLATRSSDGDVIVWDTGSWAPIQRFAREPEWNLGKEQASAMALSHDGRRLAAAYKTAFVLWDVSSGKRLADPIACGAEIVELAFVGSGSTQVEATVSADAFNERRTQRRTLTWDYADVTDTRDGKGLTELGDLTRTVAAGDWVAKAPELVAKKDCPKIIAALLEHFAAQARIERTSAQKAVDKQPAAR